MGQISSLGSTKVPHYRQSYWKLRRGHVCLDICSSASPERPLQSSSLWLGSVSAIEVLTLKWSPQFIQLTQSICRCLHFTWVPGFSWPGFSRASATLKGVSGGPRTSEWAVSLSKLTELWKYLNMNLVLCFIGKHWWSTENSLFLSWWGFALFKELTINYELRIDNQLVVNT